MKNLLSFSFLFCTILLVSCVNRIGIPEEEDSMLFISLEMVAGDHNIVADFKTSNNLNGTYPISVPSNASIIISEVNNSGKDVNNEIELLFDETMQKYVSENTETFLKRNREYELVANIENSELETITASTVVPDIIQVKQTELLAEDTYIDLDGNEYWEGVVGLTFVKSAGSKEKYGHMVISGLETERNISLENDTTYFMGMESKLFSLLGIETGRGAVTDIIHRDGFLIDFTKLEDDYLELVLRSPFPITKSNHVTDFLTVDIFSVTKAHHDYHLAFHNIKKSQGNVFDEHALYNSNIKNGLGLFSSCFRIKNILELR